MYITTLTLVNCSDYFVENGEVQKHRVQVLEGFMIIDFMDRSSYKQLLIHAARTPGSCTYNGIAGAT
jgi:hypothetical protein